MRLLKKITSGQFALNAGFILRVFILAGLCVIVFAGISYYFLNIDFSVYLPGFSLCPFRAIFHIPCPGCGMTKAMIYLGQLRISEAIKSNPFCLPFLFFAIFCLFKGETHFISNYPHLPRIIFILVMTFWILRILILL